MLTITKMNVLFVCYELLRPILTFFHEIENMRRVSKTWRFKSYSVLNHILITMKKSTEGDHRFLDHENIPLNISLLL